MAGDSVEAEVCLCKGGVNGMRQQLLAMKATVEQKTAEVAQLREIFAAQNEALNAAKAELEENKQNMHEEINTLQQNVIILHCLKYHLQSGGY